MRVLILTQHFAPEVTAGRFRVEAFASALRRRDHEVQVICPVPNHPRGVVEEGYGHRLVDRRTVAGIEVAYVRVAVAPEKTFRTRLSYYASYAVMASALGLAGRRPDVVLASSPPLTVTTAGSVVATRHRAPLVLDIRDLWPDSALDLGELRAGRAVAAMRRLERHAYAKAAATVTANDAFRRRIEDRAPPGARVEVIPNGTTQEWLEMGATEVDRASLRLPRGEYVWAYAGNIGLAHGLEFAAEAAERLGDGYRLLVIGEGPRRAELERRAAASDPPRLELRGLMPPLDAARHLRAADAVLVSERQEATVSAKLYDVCAVGRPLVAACRGELRRVIEREGIGLAVPHGDPEALAGAVRRLRSEPDLAARMVERGREFAREHLRELQADRLAGLVEEIASAP